ncbi:branched-chain amino acid transport ATP-binding protein LivF [Desulfocucumis palustris]|uniref:Branched-chain amino acid transport ATP-binding protein LivF n=1 Tax=Desulfocucumis palustris TaxID=1898651 RepID=A0A2L2XD75_9FIRM|nr:ABC transporter ATP-binding protein [Desulfocucumis palustris]GBF34299.1 branched-chain amino acid transport ATP-binding protein LivF [Desulfocucumis palustris]
MLEVKNLHTRHGWNHALKGVSFRVPAGSLTAIVGANGAGKSTLLGTVAGIYNPFRGEVVLEGRQVQRLQAEQMVRQGISLVPEHRQIFDSLSVEDNLMLGAYPRWGGDRREIKRDMEDIVNLFPALGERLGDPAGGLSGGMQQMLAIGRGLMSRPKVLLLDEPSLGLAPLLVKEIFNTLNNLRKNGTTVLLVEQNARAAMYVADMVYVMDQGKIMLEGRPDELKKDRRVQQAYLGRG